ncbi:PTS sugar transporter subunit IIA [uncultured Streptococcus sp.]|uniref:PTS sugar transporter subunit IIA n=1 Tax=uncultured Streptococcus sp. TaxID=83427 RepID=UPI0025D4948C|nr:PTS N-acetylglucosamine transporter subunit IIBC [uncultured Streptococcus sp.]
MKRRFLIVTHSTLAEGFTNALMFFAGDGIDVTYINAYIDGKPIDEKINSFFSTLNDKDELIVLTDLLAGSVNQNLYKYISREHTHILTGINLALALSLVLESANDYLTKERINQLVNSSRENIVYMNEFQAEVDDDDE